MEKIALGELCEPSRGLIKVPADTLIDYIDISGVDNESKTVTGYQTLLFGESPSRARKKVEKGDILVSTVRPNLNAVAILNEDTPNVTIASTGFCVLQCKENTDNRFVFNYCKSKPFIDEMVSQATGASYPAVNEKTIRSAKVPFYSYEKQCEIGNVLDCVADIIEKRKKILEKLDEVVKARFVEMFGDQNANPFGWKQQTIGECCGLKSGTSLPSDVENEGGSVPYVKVGDMNYPGNERYITTSSRFVSEETAGKGIFPVGSVLFPKRGGAIGTNKKRMTTLPVCADLNVMGVFSKGDLVNEYLLSFFDTLDLGALDNGSSVPQINNKDIAPLVICTPPIDLQKQFAMFVQQVDKSKVAVQKSLDEAQLLFDSLMQKYFG